MEGYSLGASIRAERLRQNWSQEGLCKGICTVSYLSKIEQGKTEASPEILHLLLERLGLEWYDEAQDILRAKNTIDDIYDAIYAFDYEEAEALLKTLENQRHRLLHGPLAAPFTLLGHYLRQEGPIREDMEPCLDRRQLALQRVLQNRTEEAMRLYPSAYVSLMAGVSAYGRGNEDAQGYLHESYDLAAREGLAGVMLMAKLYLGNCASNRQDVEQMQEHYRIASRLAKDLRRESALHDIRYNIAATMLESGHYEEAYAYFSALEEPTALEAHKYAICCEKLGKYEEAKKALEQADILPSEVPRKELVSEMCFLVRYRLEHEDYLRHEAYGQKLLDVFAACRRELPIGYANFHLPWVLEWYTANRQYRIAYELLRDFPVK